MTENSPKAYLRSIGSGIFHILIHITKYNWSDVGLKLEHFVLTKWRRITGKKNHFEFIFFLLTFFLISMTLFCFFIATKPLWRVGSSLKVVKCRLKTLTQNWSQKRKKRSIWLVSNLSAMSSKNMNSSLYMNLGKILKNCI